ncbi:MAG: hypothetical protein LHV68_09645 [Elusimicrobia bacterium]|nr:hypothetical protein [Candidatus Liberimonas magnetica]
MKKIAVLIIFSFILYHCSFLLVTDSLGEQNIFASAAAVGDRFFVSQYLAQNVVKVVDLLLSNSSSNPPINKAKPQEKESKHEADQTLPSMNKEFSFTVKTIHSQGGILLSIAKSPCIYNAFIDVLHPGRDVSWHLTRFRCFKTYIFLILFKALPRGALDIYYNIAGLNRAV